MHREVVWSAYDGTSLEHVTVDAGADEIAINGVVVAMDDGQPVRAQYALVCDAGWRVRSFRIDPLVSGAAALTLLADGAGRWTDDAGRHLALLDGCIDADLTLTPLTNTLPIRRLGLGVGESAVLQVAYIDGATFAYSVNMQRYTCLQRDARGGRFRYEGLSSGFQAEVLVDVEGFVVDYAPLFRRVWASGITNA